jgi:transposase
MALRQWRTRNGKEAAYGRGDRRKLRQVDVLTAQGRPVAEAVRAIGVTEVTYYRWRSEYGGLKGDQVRRLRSSRPRHAGCAARCRT